MPLDILYEDDDLIVVNKPPTIAVHESHNHVGDALSNALAYHLKSEGKPCAFRAVGRLDKGTSGIVVCALNKYCAAKLSGKVYKEYLAVASGVFEGEGTIDAPIYRPDPIITKRIVDGRGEKAVTHWTAVRNNGVQTLLRIKLETGRTHQIRAMLASAGHPLLGDGKYGRLQDFDNRGEKYQALCSYRLAFDFTTPAGELEYLKGREFVLESVSFADKYFPGVKYN
jgi:23S rRNA pseudouridine1911/1915/1917 synthase